MAVSWRQTLSLNFAFWRGIDSKCPSGAHSLAIERLTTDLPQEPL